MIKFEFDEIINPGALAQSESIKIYTLNSNEDIIDKLESLLTVWPTEPCLLQSKRFESQHYTVREETMLLFDFTVLLFMENNKLEVIFPNTIDISQAVLSLGGEFVDPQNSVCTKTGQRFTCT